MLEVTEELKRVLKPTGLFFLNIADKYEKKSLLMIPYRLVTRMQDEQGWNLKNVIVWIKPNAMPESMKSRFSRKYEPIFLLSKSKKVYFNLDAVREPHKTESVKRYLSQSKKPKVKKEIWKSNDPKQWFHKLTKHEIAVKRKGSYTDSLHKKAYFLKGKNPGDAWLIPTQPFPEAHFSTFPEALVERCIRCGCPDKVCKKCGMPYLEQYYGFEGAFNIRVRDMKTKPEKWGKLYKASKEEIESYDEKHYKPEVKKKVVLSCNCNAGYIPGLVLDPFVGSGTTLKVAIEMKRNAIGIEMKPEYIKIIKKRINFGGGFVKWKFIKL